MRHVCTTAPSTGAEDAGETRFNLVFQERDKLWIAPLVLIGDVERDDPVIGGARLVLFPDAFAVVGLHREDQIGNGDKLLGQRVRSLRIRACRHGLDAREIREHVLGGRASELVSGANEQDFHTPIIAHDVAMRNPASLAFGKIADPYQFDLVFGMQRIGVRHVLWPLYTAVKAQLPA